MFCSNCGKENSEESIHCFNCGQKITGKESINNPINNSIKYAIIFVSVFAVISIISFISYTAYLKQAENTTKQLMKESEIQTQKIMKESEDQTKRLMKQSEEETKRQMEQYGN